VLVLLEKLFKKMYPVSYASRSNPLCRSGLLRVGSAGVWLITASTASAKQIALYSHTTVKKITLLLKTIFVDVISVQNT